MTPGQKLCLDCGEVKDHNEFYPYITPKVIKPTKYCKICTGTRVKDRYVKNRKKNILNMRKWRANNKTRKALRA